MESLQRSLQSEAGQGVRSTVGETRSATRKLEPPGVERQGRPEGQLDPNGGSRVVTPSGLEVFVMMVLRAYRRQAALAVLVLTGLAACQQQEAPPRSLQP